MNSKKNIAKMQPTLLANSWAVAHLPNELYLALLCCAGSGGEAAFHNSLDEQFANVGYWHLGNPSSQVGGQGAVLTSFSANTQAFGFGFGTATTGFGTANAPTPSQPIRPVPKQKTVATSFGTVGSALSPGNVHPLGDRTALTRRTPTYHIFGTTVDGSCGAVMMDQYVSYCPS